MKSREVLAIISELLNDNIGESYGDNTLLAVLDDDNELEATFENKNNESFSFQIKIKKATE